MLANGDTAAARMRIYKMEDSILKTRYNVYQKHLKDSYRLTQEQMLVGTTVGASKIALGVCGMIAGWHHFNDPLTHHRLIAAGTTSYQVGVAEVILDTLRLRAMGESAAAKLKKQNLLPRQVFQQHLQTLDSMEQELSSRATK
jgi:hypothetical protein